jgi:hypothetical protein
LPHGVTHERIEERGLTDPGWATDHDDAASPCRGCAHGVAERAEFPLTLE